MMKEIAMYSLLLVIIYLAFISLGLPDSLLGSGWPIMHLDIGVSIAYAGIISMTISLGTIISSLMTDRLARKLGTGPLTAISVLMTAVAMFGFSLSNSFVILCFWAIPYGLGAGAVDAALNNYIALHYASRHMSWLHCFWGVGASISPYIMSSAIASGQGWQNGYSFVGIIQIIITFFLFMSLPLWTKNNIEKEKEKNKTKPLSIKEVLNIKGVKYVLFTFLAYSAVENTAGLWASTYLVEFRGVDVETAAKFASLFYIGITIGRFLSGFVSDRIGDKWLIRYGLIVVTVGISLVVIPINTNSLALGGLIIIGLGCAPIFPSIIHSTPYNFGAKNSQSIIGIQMASAYAGSIITPTLFGGLVAMSSLVVFPFFLFVFTIIMIVTSERLNKVIKAKDSIEVDRLG